MGSKERRRCIFGASDGVYMGGSGVYGGERAVEES